MSICVDSLFSLAVGDVVFDASYESFSSTSSKNRMLTRLSAAAGVLIDYILS